MVTTILLYVIEDEKPSSSQEIHDCESKIRSRVPYAYTHALEDNGRKKTHHRRTIMTARFYPASPVPECRVRCVLTQPAMSPAAFPSRKLRPCSPRPKKVPSPAQASNVSIDFLLHNLTIYLLDLLPIITRYCLIYSPPDRITQTRYAGVRAGYIDSFAAYGRSG